MKHAKTQFRNIFKPWRADAVPPPEEWTYSVDEMLQDAFLELGVHPKHSSRIVPDGASINTRHGVPTIPTFKGVRYLGTLTFPQRIKARAAAIRDTLKTGKFASRSQKLALHPYEVV